MALRIVEAPGEVWTAYEVALTDYLGGAPQESELYYLPVGVLSLKQVARGAAPNDIMRCGSRFYARWPGNVATSSEMTDPGNDAGPEFRNFVEKGAPEVTVTRIDEAKALPDVQANDYELHWLSIPDLHFEALHLARIAPAGDDLLLPVLSFDTQFGVDAVLKAADFFREAQPIAAARLKLASDSPFSS
jgi:hypothetical protein